VSVKNFIEKSRLFALCKKIENLLKVPIMPCENKIKSGKNHRFLKNYCVFSEVFLFF